MMTERIFEQLQLALGRDMLAFEHDHPGPGREVIGGGNPGDAGADDGEIELLHAG